MRNRLNAYKGLLRMTEPQPLYPGVSIGGHYTVGTLINTGGFGSVYRGIDGSEGNRPCAIKETYDVTPSARRQALMEAAILFTIKSEHLPQVYDAFEANGRFYLVMQLIEGENLLQLLGRRGKPCSEQEVLAWLLPIMDVLQELHSRSSPVLHRDIKPANIILTPNQTAVLVDFGLTKLYDPSKDTSSLVRAISEGFSPVEQYIGKTSPQSDIYALAATIYFLLTQTTPPASIDRSLQDLLLPPRLLNPLISPKVERVLLKALAVSPDQRYQSMQEFARALREPAFYAYADQTISDNSVPDVPAPTPVAQTGVAAPYPPAYSSWGGRYQPGQSQAPAYRSLPPPVYPVPTPSRPGEAPAERKVQKAPAPKIQSLPGSFNQGCLWGILQGVLSALILLFLRGEAFFYLALLEGFLFYLCAGFFTVRKGGATFRGALAGFWSGIISTISFWLVFPLILLILLAQRIQLDTAYANKHGTILNFNEEFMHALQTVTPVLPNHSTSQTPTESLIVYLAGGLLCAIILGCLGGFLGKRAYR
jgi:serine/threonine protein kinase